MDAALQCYIDNDQNLRKTSGKFYFVGNRTDVRKVASSMKRVFTPMFEMIVNAIIVNLDEKISNQSDPICSVTFE